MVAAWNFHRTNKQQPAEEIRLAVERNSEKKRQ